MNIKQSFIQKVIQNNYTITETILEILKTDFVELRNITINDFLSYDKELIISLPNEKYNNYCNYHCLYTKEAKIIHYFSPTNENNLAITFLNLISYYIKFMKYKEE